MQSLMYCLSSWPSIGVQHQQHNSCDVLCASLILPMYSLDNNKLRALISYVYVANYHYYYCY